MKDFKGKIAVITGAGSGLASYLRSRPSWKEPDWHFDQVRLV